MDFATLIEFMHVISTETLKTIAREINADAFRNASNERRNYEFLSCIGTVLRSREGAP